MSVNSKILTFNSVAETVSELKSSGSKIGLITGCFDILHIGHISLFQFAKKEVDILIVGVDNDNAIKMSKGHSRPINNQKIRMEILSYISLINYLFPLDFNGKFGHKASNIFMKNIYKNINPNCIISSTLTDKYVKSKKVIANELNIKFLPFDKAINISSTTIEKIINQQ